MKRRILPWLMILCMAVSPAARASAAPTEVPNAGKWLMQTIDFMYNTAMSILEAAPGVKYEECTLRAFIEMENGISLEDVDYVGYRYFRPGKTDKDFDVGEAEIGDQEGIANFVRVLETFRGVPIRLPSATGMGNRIRLATEKKLEGTTSRIVATIEQMPGGFRVSVRARQYYFPCRIDGFLDLADMTR